ncbi:hypothetical protein HYH03_018714 [Edaphochlamys debaryana]|uniref:Uncharacterized protein n=1 Tax=Edaphochlamys debaryana TaxID=47281 RepID=A0A836BP43_9CHLO|nr:hypothetical protein HYH03_018714 [Edaphochlamys debaryana]|eukprot:KAG2482364.1 hypothetical protein HYH03_018714 [Edaphochlamys debaryana]
MSNKRSSSYLGGDSSPDLHILVAGREEPLPAHRRVLSLFSGVVDGLPSNTDGSPTPWDLRGLVLEGESEPVAAAVVESWLDTVKAHISTPQRPKIPGSLEAARPLLLFADAVDTSPAVLQALGGGPPPWRRPDRCYCLRMLWTQLPVCTTMIGALVMVSDETFDQHKDAFPSAVARELESWLHLAGRLNLVPLARLLTSFIKVHIMPNVRSILLPSIASMFSPRVLQFMPRELLLEAYVRDALMERPAQATINVSEVELNVATPLLSAWFNKPLGTATKAGAKPMPDTLTLVTVKMSGQELPLNATMGGPGPKECAQVLEEVMAKALEEE